jgi:hypothetical protein
MQRRDASEGLRMKFWIVGVAAALSLIAVIPL